MHSKEEIEKRGAALEKIALEYITSYCLLVEHNGEVEVDRKVLNWCLGRGWNDSYSEAEVLHIVAKVAYEEGFGYVNLNKSGRETGIKDASFQNKFWTGMATIKKMMEKVLLGWADKTMGAGLAILKGIIIVYFALVLLSVYIPSQTPLIARSKLAPIIITSYQSLSGLISPGAYQKWKKRFLGDRKLKEGAEPDKSQTPSQKDGSRQTI